MIDLRVADPETAKNELIVQKVRELSKKWQDGYMTATRLAVRMPDVGKKLKEILATGGKDG